MKDFMPLTPYWKRTKMDAQTDNLKLHRLRLETSGFLWLCMFQTSDCQDQAKG